MRLGGVLMAVVWLKMSGLAACTQQTEFYDDNYQALIKLANGGDVPAARGAYAYCQQFYHLLATDVSIYADPCGGAFVLRIDTTLQFGKVEEVDELMHDLEMIKRPELQLRMPMYRKAAEARRLELSATNGI